MPSPFIADTSTSIFRVASPDRNQKLSRSPLEVLSALQDTDRMDATVATPPEPRNLVELPAANHESEIHESWPGASGLAPQLDQSRKRSRSGQRLGLSSPNTKNGIVRTKESMRSVALEQYLHREQSWHAALSTSDWRHKKLRDKQSAASESPVPHIYLDFPDPRFRDAPENLRYGHSMVQRRKHGVSIVLPQQRRDVRSAKINDLRISRLDQATQAEQIDELVPIRLDVEQDQIRLRDTFTWNIHDRVIGIDRFSQQLVDDFHLDLPPPQSESLVRDIQTSMQEQLNDFHPHIFIEEEALDPHLPYSAYKNDEMRVVIKLNITIGQYTLVDQFEWEINNPLNLPENFAWQMARDLSLSGEFVTAIAHSIREQSQLFTRSLYVVGHPFDGRSIEDHELLASFQPSPLSSAFRPYQAAKEFTPCLYELNEAELEKTELSLSREERRQKRSVNRRGGPTLPDLKDRRRTIRTLLLSTVLPGAVHTVEESRIYKRLATAGKGRKGPNRDGYDEFDDSDSDGSLVGSPAVSVHPYAGTARTRGIRGAASAAQAAMRANLGRSATPESGIVHHHETRASGRRTIRDESTPESQPTLMVVLRLSSTKLRKLGSKPPEGSRTGSPAPSGLVSHMSKPIQNTMGTPASLVQDHSFSQANSGQSFRNQALGAATVAAYGSPSHNGRTGFPSALAPDYSMSHTRLP